MLIAHQHTQLRYDRLSFFHSIKRIQLNHNNKRIFN